MNWDYILITLTVAASLAYLARRIVVRKNARACTCATSSCACCPQAPSRRELGELVPLRQLALGCKARIVSIHASGELGRRIRDMGLVPGEEIQVIGRAPLKDPVSLRLRGFTLSLRNSEADQIIVEPCA